MIFKTFLPLALLAGSPVGGSTEQTWPLNYFKKKEKRKEVTQDQDLASDPLKHH